MYVYCFLSETFNIDFSRYKDVLLAFTKLFATFEKSVKASNEDFGTIKSSCVVGVNEPLHLLIKRATDTNEIFEILANNREYCNWMNVSALEVVAIACGNENLLSLLHNYKISIYSRSLREVLDYTKGSTSEMKDIYYRRAKEFYASPSHLTIKNLMDEAPQLAENLAMDIAGVQKN